MCACGEYYLSVHLENKRPRGDDYYFSTDTYSLHMQGRMICSASFSRLVWTRVVQTKLIYPLQRIFPHAQTTPQEQTILLSYAIMDRSLLILHLTPKLPHITAPMNAKELKPVLHVQRSRHNRCIPRGAGRPPIVLSLVHVHARANHTV